MPAFLVHGVPDTAHLWDNVRSHLQRDDIIAPSLPGFSTPPPDGFDSTKEAYADWLIARVEEVGEPVDIVGHDWGAMLVQRLVSQRPDLVRTWAVGSGPLDTDYVWHDTAKAWQTPVVGEQLMQAFTPDAMTAVFMQQGLTEADARGVGERVDDTMKTSILALYRSAMQVAVDWPPLASSDRPGLALSGADDPYVPPPYMERLAERTGAKCVVFEKCSHWWPQQRPAEVAALLTEHWSR
jgi:pimeloyl-ACP methyl ester carboxylesterase